MNDSSNNEVPVNSKLCYLSVVALFLAIFGCITPSVARDVIKMEILALAIATVSLVRIKLTNVKLRGKGLAIAAIVISLTYTLFLFAAWFARTRPYQLM